MYCVLHNCPRNSHSICIFCMLIGTPQSPPTDSILQISPTMLSNYTTKDTLSHTKPHTRTHLHIYDFTRMPFLYTDTHTLIYTHSHIHTNAYAICVSYFNNDFSTFLHCHTQDTCGPISNIPYGIV